MVKKIINLLKKNFPQLLLIYYKIRFLVRAIYLKEPRAHLLWKLNRGDKRSLGKFDLNSQSIFFDVGGFEGVYTENIINLYDCTSYIFEPHPYYFDKLKTKFKGYKNVKVYNFGLAGKTEYVYLTDKLASSSVTLQNTNLRIEVRDIVEVIHKLELKKIDLLKLNIEGSEYDLLERLIESGEIKNIIKMKIQFHDNVENYLTRRLEIREKLKSTHKEIWSYYFVWERWDLIN